MRTLRTLSEGLSIARTACIGAIVSCAISCGGPEKASQRVDPSQHDSLDAQADASPHQEGKGQTSKNVPPQDIPDTSPPAVPNGLLASPTGATVIGLTWEVSSDNGGSGLRGYKIYRDGAFVQEVAAPAAGCHDIGLTASTLYSYKITAVDLAANESMMSPQVQATTLPPPSDITAPPTPAALTATVSGSSRINMSWEVVVDAGGSGLRGYRIYRNGAFLREVEAPATHAIDTGLASATSYSYQVTAVDIAANESPQSAQVSATTTAADGSALYAATCASCHGPLATSAKLGRTAAQIQEARTSTATMISNPGVQLLTTAEIQGIATALVVMPDTTAPSVPGSFAASAPGATVIALTWTAATDIGGSGVRGYKIYRDGTLLQEVAAPAVSFNNTGLTASTLYTYKITAIDVAANESAMSPQVQATTLPPAADVTRPPTPAGLRATAAGSSRINLSWGAVVDGGGSGLRGYKIYRNGTFLREIAAPATTTSDTGLAATTDYAYRVAAIDIAANESLQSAQVSARTAAIAGSALYAAACASCHGPLATSAKLGRTAAQIQAARTSVATMISNPDVQLLTTAEIQGIATALVIVPDTVAPSIPGSLTATATGATVIALTWTAATDTGGSGVRGYKIYRNGTFLQEVAAPAGSFNNTGLAASTLYAYKITAIDMAANESAMSPQVQATTLPPPADITQPPIPAGLTASAAGSSRVNLSWGAVVDAGGSGLRGYKVYRNGTFLREIAAPATTTSDTGLAAATGYAYRVAAVDIAANESPQSAQVSATTAAVNGSALYAATCASCHGPLATSIKLGRTAAQIQAARTSVATMISSPDVQLLTSAEIQGIATALVIVPDTTAPSIPGAVAASATGATVIALTWTAATDTGGSGVRGYRIYRNGTFLQEIAAPAGSFNNTGLAASTLYTYKITAIDVAANESAMSPQAQATTLPPPSDIIPPPTPPELSATAAGSSRVNLGWGAVVDAGGSGLRGYKIYRNGIFLREIAAPATATSDTGLAAATSYTYRVAAVDIAANESLQSNPASATTAAIDGPALYAATCARCHGPLATSAKLGRTSAQIQGARTSVANMVSDPGVQLLTPPEIQSIAAALNPTSCNPADELASSMQARCSTCHSGAAGLTFANLNVDAVATWGAQDARWPKVFAVISSGAMPPGGSIELQNAVASCQSRLHLGPPLVDPIPDLCVATGVTGASHLLRLGPVEYENSLRVVFGNTLMQAAAADLLIVPNETYKKYSSELGPLNLGHTEAYSRVARSLARAASVDSTFMAQNASCIVAAGTAAPSATCVANSLSPIAAKLYRRPLDQLEYDAIKSVFDAGRSISNRDGVEVALRVIMEGSPFLYRLEGRGAERGDGTRDLTSFEVASRLAFFLTRAPPDDTLRTNAATGAILQPAVLRAEAQRLFASAAAQANLRNFFGEWVGYARLLPLSYPASDFSQGIAVGDIAPAARTELNAFFDSIMFGGGTFEDIFLSRTAVVDARLAGIYGVSASAPMTTVDLNADNYAGVLTRVGFIASGTTMPRPMHLGAQIRRNFLCDDLPPPPPNITAPPPPGTPEGTRLLSSRERFERKTSEPACFACHVRINGLGLALLDRDAIGRYTGTSERLYESNGHLIGQTNIDLRLSPGIVSVTEDSVQGAVQLSEEIAQSLKAKQCFAKATYHFLASHKPSDNHGCQIQSGVDIITSGGTLADSVLAFILAPEFRIYQPAPIAVNP